MAKILRLTNLSGIQLLDSRGNPTVGVSATVEKCTSGFASVPSGASTGEHEAIELRDKSSDYNGLGVSLAVDNVNEKIQEEILGKDVVFQGKIDDYLLKLDSSSNKENLGANATLGVSMAVCDAAANAFEILIEVVKQKTHLLLIFALRLMQDKERLVHHVGRKNG